MKAFIKKHYKKCLLALFCVTLTMSFAACKDDNPSGGGNSSEIEQEMTPLALDKVQVSMLIGEETWLTATYMETEGNVLTWQSSNPEIVTVDQDGKLVAIKAGETIITASYGEEQATCNVSVGTGNMLPTILMEGFSNEETSVSVAVQDVLNVKAKLLFNGKTFEDVEWEYTLSNPAIGSIENGVFTAIERGETELTIKGKWRDMQSPTLTKTVTIKVVDSIKFVINGGLTDSLYLYTKDLHGGESYATSSPFEVTVEENGQVIQPTVTISKGEQIISYDGENKQVNALTYGEAEITISFIDGDGVENTMLVPVLVQRPVAKYSKTIEYFSAMDGDLPIVDIFGSETTLTDAYHDGSALTVTPDNLVMGVPTDSKGMQATELVIYNDTVGYLLNVEAYTKVVDEESDLTVFDTDQNGYFVLKNEIECSRVWSNKGTFAGTFDGQGYAIRNAKFSVDTNTYKGGLFGSYGEGAHVKNVAFMDVDLSQYNATVLAGGSSSSYYANALTENVYIHVKKVGTRFGALMWQRGPWDRFHNVIVDMRAMDSVASSGSTYGALFACDNWAAANNGQVWKDDNSRITNVYVLAKEGTPMMCNSSYGQWTATIYASNDGIVEDAAARKYVYSGVKRFASLELLSAAVLKVGDDENYWTVTETGIEWKGELPETPTLTYEKTIKNFSAMDGILPIAEIFGDDNVVITDAYQSGTQLKVENNRVLGVSTYSDRVTETQIIIYTARGNYILNLEAYTMILDEESDLAAFSTQTQSVTGYFVLANDIVCTGQTVWNNINVSRDKYFNGVLDGQGHKIIGAKVGDNGIFGTLGANAIIKNIAFTDITLTGRDSWKNTALLAHESLASSSSKSSIENVYINISNFREADGGNRAAGLLYVYNSDIKIKDVIVDIESTNFMERPQYGYGALFEHDKVKGEAKNITNVYVVSKLIPIAMHTQDNIATDEWDPVENAAGYASNDQETSGKIETNTYFYYNGVQRYDDVEALSKVTQKVGNWSITAEGIVWVATEE